MNDGAVASQHAVRFYTDHDYPARRIADHLEGALACGGAGLLFATPEHQVSVTAMLEQLGVDVERSIDTGRLKLGDAETAARAIVEKGKLNRSAFEDIVAGPVRAAVLRNGRMRAYGEIVNVLARKGDLAGALGLEELWSELLAEAPVELLCGYSLGSFLGHGSVEAFSRVCGEHGGVEPIRSDVPAPRARLVAELEQRTLALEHEAARAREECRRAEDARKDAEAANRAKDEFLAMLGHELRNPLSPILTAVQLMRLRDDGVLVKERRIIERQVNHMVRLVDDLLDVSRIARGKVELRRLPVEMARVVANAIEMASPLLEERAHRLVTSVPASGLLVDADASRLAQVIANLLSNAAKFTPARGVVTVTARLMGQSVELSVSDDGGGIDPELLPNVFDLFVQGHQGFDRPRGGLGLGLSIARNLIEMHGGSLRAESEGKGRGSVFTLVLPALPKQKSEGEPRSAPFMAAEAAGKVLVVDDNRDAAESVREFLEAVGHSARVAHDGPSALEAALEFRPHVALLDLGLPVMDGHELGRRLRAALSTEAPKLIAITGYGDELDRRRSLEAGFHRHLVKPVDLQELHALIEDLLSERRDPAEKLPA